VSIWMQWQLLPALQPQLQHWQYWLPASPAKKNNLEILQTRKPLLTEYVFNSRKRIIAKFQNLSNSFFMACRERQLWFE
jgi:hypothetical protein